MGDAFPGFIRYAVRSLVVRLFADVRVIRTSIVRPSPRAKVGKRQIVPDFGRLPCALALSESPSRDLPRRRQARGRAVDKRAEIWAFGVLFYEILSRHFTAALSSSASAHVDRAVR